LRHWHTARRHYLQPAIANASANVITACFTSTTPARRGRVAGAACSYAGIGLRLQRTQLASARNGCKSSLHQILVLARPSLPNSLMEELPIIVRANGRCWRHASPNQPLSLILKDRNPRGQLLNRFTGVSDPPSNNGEHRFRFRQFFIRNLEDILRQQDNTAKSASLPPSSAAFQVPRARCRSRSCLK
jgi:hypothetical protein